MYVYISICGLQKVRQAIMWIKKCQSANWWNMRESGQDDNRPILVLDLDETLVRVTRLKTKHPSTKIVVKRHCFFVQKRPSLNEFFNTVSKDFDIFFFTASEKDYAIKVVHEIVPDFPIEKCYFKDSLVPESGALVKDLRVIGAPLNKIVFIDDMQSSGLHQPENTIVIRSWFGEEDDDILYNSLLPLLLYVKEADDVPAALKKGFREQEPKGLTLLCNCLI